MTGNFYTFFYLPFVVTSCAGSVLLAGYLFLLEIRELRAKCGLSSRRRNRGPQGICVWVRGLGLRSEPAAASLTRASQIGTLSFSSISKAGTIATIRASSAHEVLESTKPQVITTRTTGAEKILFFSVRRG
jgi:hypothetical protein